LIWFTSNLDVFVHTCTKTFFCHNIFQPNVRCESHKNFYISYYLGTSSKKFIKPFTIGKSHPIRRICTYLDQKRTCIYYRYLIQEKENLIGFNINWKVLKFHFTCPDIESEHPYLYMVWTALMTKLKFQDFYTPLIQNYNIS
jgi:hypothetical protein